MSRTTRIPSVSLADGSASNANLVRGLNNTVYQSDEDARIMQWLSPLDPGDRHQSLSHDRFDGAGEWFFQTSEFREWRGCQGGPDNAVLFCNGNPGAGKTYLSSLVIDSLLDQARGEDVGVAGIYCDYLAQQDQTITNIMGAIVRQLIARGGIPEYLRRAFRKGERRELGGKGLRLPELMEILRITVASLSQIFICIDALDECLPQQLPELLESLRGIVRDSPAVRIFLTGRQNIKEDIQTYFTTVAVIAVSPNADDIQNYLEMRLDKDVEPQAMDDNLRADIMGSFQERVSDIFLLVSLSIDAILGEVTIPQRRKRLVEMTEGNGLNDAYTAALTRLRAQKGDKSELGMKVLMWVLYSERPLLTGELCHALGVVSGSSDMDPENAPALQTLLESTQGLVTVELSSSTVRLVHLTLHEHLIRDPSLFHGPHSTMAAVCLTYLNFGSVRDLSPTLHSAPSSMPFLEYASCYWGNHTREGMTENVKALALRLLDSFDEHISARLMLLRYTHDTFWGPYFREARPKGFTGLHAAAFLGTVGIVSAVLRMKEWDVNAKDCTGSTALIWAAAGGHEEVVKALLERQDVDCDLEDTEWGQSPLSWASQQGCEGVARILLEREDVNPNQAGTTDGRTPLSWAAGCGHERVVKMLLEREDVNPDETDRQYGQTPLSWAAEHGHQEVVKMLLEREDVDPDRADIQYGRTPLSLAAECGHEGVAKLLLEREDVNPDQVDRQYGQTPLSWAAEHGYDGVVGMLLERDEVNPDHADTQYGRTPLSLAAECGREEVVRMLLEREDVNPDHEDKHWGRTPLLWAAGCGHERVVRMLLEREEVNPDHADSQYGRTPLSWAAKHGHEGVVKMLLEREEVNPDHVDIQCSRSPLSLAAESGHEGVVKLLLEREDVNPDQTDRQHSRTPLWWAAEHGHEGVVKMLLEREGVNPDHADIQYGRTPLSWAAVSGHEGVVGMLLG